MKVKYILKGIIATLLLTFIFTNSSCESYTEELLDGLGNTREFSPVELTAKIRNQTTVELNWSANESVDHYVIEFSADDPNFTTIFKTVKVTGDDLPVQVALEGETLYSIRVKAVSSGLEDSKWTVTTANTLSEMLFLPVQDGDLQAKEVTLRWVANSAVTKIVITPGNITHDITPQEKINGVAVVTGLTGETTYTADLFNGTKRRGSQVFKTAIDIGTGILVKPTDDLVAIVETADEGAILVLEPGVYKSTATEIVFKKAITIRGLRTYDRPVLHYKFTANAESSSVSLIDLHLDGTGIENASVLTVAGTASNTDILVSGCDIHDYTRSLIAGGNVSGSKVKSLTIDNCTVKNVNTNAGADFIDFRATHVADIIIKNSTFDTCSTGRDFVRVDNAGLTGTGLTTTVVIDGCTLYKVSDTSAPKRILYVRFASNACTVKNTLITNTTAIYSNQPSTDPPTFNNNYYFNAASFKDATIVNNRVDTNGTVADPQFEDAATGNFTISNQSLIDDKIGDPRWIK